MVCLGNICRSPLAEGILRNKLLSEGLNVEVDSAGTIGLHAGEKPDQRMRKTALSFGVDIEDLRARQVTKDDLKNFDVIYAMDKSNYSNLLKLTNVEIERSKVRLILDEVEDSNNKEVPDPYFGDEQGFIDVYNLLDRATDKIIEKLKSNGKYDNKG